MQTSIKKLPKSIIEISFELASEEVAPFLNSAAGRLAERHKIPGFRPGKAPFELVKNRFGEMKIYDEALEEIVRHFYSQAVLENNLKAIGQPHIALDKMAPGNPLSFRASVPVLPEITKLADHNSIPVTMKEPQIAEEDITKALAELQKMQTREEAVARAATKDDRVTVDMDIRLDNVSIEGGKAAGHAVYLSEQHFVPGFAEALLGLKKGDEKTFRLPFPKEHYRKQLAGKDVDFSVTVKEVAALHPPALDDSFAQILGQKTLVDLRALIRKNMEEDAAAKEKERQEIETLEWLVDNSKFEDVPELLLDAEINKMVEELSSGIAAQGLTLEQYLKNLNKSLPQLKLDFSPQAIKRIKTSLVIRAVAEKEKIEATDGELQEETEKFVKLYEKEQGVREHIKTEHGQDYLRGIIKNRKVIAFLKTKTAPKK